MALESANYISQLVNSNPDGAVDQKSGGDDHLRLLKRVLQNTFPNMAGPAWRVQFIGSTYTVLPTDNMTILHCVATVTLNLSAAATLGNQFLCMVIAGAGDVTVDPMGAETVNGIATQVIPHGTFGFIISNSGSITVVAPASALGGSRLLPTVSIQGATTSLLNLLNTDPTYGPSIDTTHQAAAPAAYDQVFRINNYARNAALTMKFVGQFIARMIQPNTGAEYLEYVMHCIANGAITESIKVAGHGVVVGPAAGSYQGGGIINVSGGFRVNGVPVETLGGLLYTSQLFQYHLASGTHGPLYPGGVWTQVPFNTVNYDLGIGASLSGNNIVIPTAGWYEIDARINGFSGADSGTNSRIINMSTGVTQLWGLNTGYGGSGASGDAGQTAVHGAFYHAVAGQHIGFQVFPKTSFNQQKLNSSNGVVEVYSTLHLKRVR